MKTMKEIADDIRRAQIYPATTRVEVNDKMTSKLFNLTDYQFQKMRTGKQAFTVVEGNVKGETVESTFKIRSDSDEPLTAFDYFVFNACNSEFNAGNFYTTPSIIFRALTGKIGKGDAEPSKDQIAAIRQSITKLRRTDFLPDISDAFTKLKYEDVTLKIKESSVLPCVVLNAEINGQLVEDAIYFDRESPLWIIANAKSQIIRYDARLLDVPNLRNTPRIITLKNYVVHRVHEIKAHKMTPTLTFDDIFQKVRITDVSNQSKLDAREAVKIFFEHLQSKGVIKSFELVKKANQFYAMTFTF